MPNRDRPLPAHRRHLTAREAVRGVLLADAVFLMTAVVLGFGGGPFGALMALVFTTPVIIAASLLAAPVAVGLSRWMHRVDTDDWHLLAQFGTGALLAGVVGGIALAIAGMASIGPALPGLIAAVSVASGVAAAIGWSWSAALAGRADRRAALAAYRGAEEFAPNQG